MRKIFFIVALLFSSLVSFSAFATDGTLFYRIGNLNPDNAGKLKIAFQSEHKINIDYYCVPAGLFTVPACSLTKEEVTAFIKEQTKLTRVVLLETYTKADADRDCAATRKK